MNIPAIQSLPTSPALQTALNKTPIAFPKVLHTSLPSLKKNFEGYALKPSWQTIVSPIIHFLRNLWHKICLFFGLRPGIQKQAEMNSGILNGVLHALPNNSLECRSIAIDYVRNYLKHQVKENSPEEKFLKQLDFCQEIAATIEQLQAQTQPSTRNAFKAMIQKVNGRIASLPIGDKLILPGGSFQNGKWCDAIYEITCEGEKLYKVAHISLEKDTAPFLAGEKNLQTDKKRYSIASEFTGITYQDATESLLPLFRLQFPMHQAKKGGRGFFGERIFAIQKMFLNDTEKSNVAIPKITPLHVMKGFYNKDPIFSDQKASLEESPSFFKTTLASLRLLNPTAYKKNKLEFQFTTFFQTFAASEKLLNNQALCTTLHESGRKLLFQLVKRQASLGLSQKECDELTTSVQGILKQLEAKHKTLQGNKLGKLKPSSFIETFSLKPPLNEKQWQPADPPAAQYAAFAFTDLQIEKGPAVAFTQLESAKKQCQLLLDKGSYASLEQAVLHAVQQLPIPKEKGDFWETLDPKTVRQWHHTLYSLSEQLFECHRILQPLCVPAEVMMAQASLQAIADRLLVLDTENKALYSNPKGQVVRFDSVELRQLVQTDDYFRIFAAHQQKRAEDIIQYWEAVKKDPKRVRVRMDGESTTLPSDESVYLGGLLKLKNQPVNQKSMQKAFSEFEYDAKDGILPLEVIQQRKMFVMMRTLQTNNAHIISHNLTDLLRSGSQMVSEAGGSVDHISRSELWRRIFAIVHEKANIALAKEAAIDKTTGHRKPLEWHYDFEKGGISLGNTGTMYAPEAYNKWKQWHADIDFFRHGGKYIDDKHHQEVIKFSLGTFNDTQGKIATQQAVVNHCEEEAIAVLKCVQANESRFDQTIATFTGKPELWDSPSQQRIFELNFYKQGVLLAKLHKQPAFAAQFLSALQDNWNLALGLGNTTRALFILQLMSSLSDYVQASKLTRQQKIAFDDQCGDLVSRYQEIEAKAKNAEEIRAVLVQKLAYYCHEIQAGRLSWAHLKPENKLSQMREIVTASCLLQNLKPKKEKRDPTIERQATTLLALVSGELEKLCQDPQKRDMLINDLFTQIEGHSLPAKTTIGGKFPQYTFGSYCIDLLKGEMTNKSTRKGILPEEEEALACSIAKFPVSPECLVAYKMDKRTKTPVVVYQPTSHPNIKIIRKEGQGLYLEKKLGSKDWYELIQFNEGGHELPQEIAGLAMHNEVWRKKGNPKDLVIMDKNTGQKLYKIQLARQGKQWKLQQVTRCSDSLQLLSPWKTPLGQLAAIEHPNFLYFWGKGGIVSHVECKRMIMGDSQPLTYDVAKDGTLLSRQFEGYTLQLNPKLEQSEELEELLPPTFKHFHCLQTPQGARKILIPLKPVTHLDGSHDAKYGAWSDTVAMDHEPNSKKPTCLLDFDVDAIKSILKTEDKKGLLYLAYLFFTHKQYEKGLEYLQKAKIATAMTRPHEEIFEWIETWPDKTEEGNAFKLHAALSLAQYQESSLQPIHSTKEQHTAFYAIKQRYEQYSENKEQLSHLLMLPKDQENTYQALLKKTYIPAYQIIKPAQILEKLEPEQLQTNPLDKTPAFTAYAFACQVYLEMENTKPFKGLHDYSFNPDTSFVQGFKGLYESIYAADPATPEFKRLKGYIEHTPIHSSSTNALEAQRYLRALILVKEAHHQGKLTQPLIDFAFPQKFPLPFLKLLRYKKIAVPNQEPQLKSLANPLNHLQEFMNTQKVPNKPFTQPTPPPNINFDPMKLPAPHWTEILLKLKIDTELQSYNILALPNVEQYELLDKMNKLDPLGKARRISQLHLQANELSKYLDNHLPDPSKPPAQPFQASPTAVLKLDGNACFVKTPNPHTIQASKAPKLFDACLEDEKATEKLKDLAQQHQDDTTYYLQNQETQSVGFAKNLQKTVLCQALAQENKLAQQERISKEKQVLGMLQAGKLSANSAKNFLTPALNTIPDRLLGCYFDFNLEKANELLGLSFSVAELVTLDELLTDYVKAAVRERVAVRATKLTSDLPENLLHASPEQAQELWETAAAEHQYSLKDPFSRDLLAIEFHEGIILRKNQIETIYGMLSGKNQVRQLELGGGKTTILLPRLLRGLADGTHLAMGILPEWMYASVLADLDRNSLTYYGQPLHRFEFDRNTPLDHEWLLQQYVQIASTIKKRGALITTKSYLLSFRDKFLELLKERETASSDDVGRLNIQIALMARILLLFKERGSAIADEIDSILDIRKELNYALGDLEKVDPLKIDMGVNVFQKMLAWTHGQNDALKKYGTKMVNNQQASLLEKEIEAAQKQLATEYWQEWQAALPLAEVTEEAFIQYMHGKLEADKDVLPGFMATLKQQNFELYKKIGFARQYLIYALPTTLSRSGNLHYGRLGDKTVPYKASNSPSDAEFGESFELISYFIQDYVQQGISEGQIKGWLATLLAKVNAEMYESLIQTGSMGTYEKTATVQAFKKSFPSIDLVKAYSDPSLIKKLSLTFNSSSENKLEFVQKWILSTLEMASYQISSNALDLFDMTESFSGFTGTPWNIDTFHNGLDTTQAIAKGTTGHSIALLQRLFESGELKIRDIELDPAKPLESLFKSMPDLLTTYDVLLDGGAYLKGLSNQKVANQIGDKGLLNSGSKRATLFINEDNQKVIQDFSSHVPAPFASRKDVGLHERFSYYDQASCIGTHIVHSNTARAGVTISEKMYIKDLIQTIWRMRRIDKGQKIDFIISKEVRQLIMNSRLDSHPNKNDPVITLEDIILFCLKNESERVADDSLVADKLKLGHIVPNVMFWQVVKSVVNFDSQVYAQNTVPIPLHALYSPFLYRKSADDYDRYAQIATKEHPHLVLNKLRQELKTAYEDLLPKLSGCAKEQKELAESIESLQNHKLLPAKKLPSKVDTLVSNAKNSQIETQRQQQQQIFAQNKMMQAKGASDKWKPWKITPKSLKQLWDLGASMEAVHSGVPLIDANIKFSQNFLPNLLSGQKMTLTDRLLVSKRPPVEQVVVIKEKATNTWRAILVDIAEYERMIAPLFKTKNQDTYEAAVFDVRPQKGCSVFCSTVPFEECPWQNGKDKETCHRLLMQIKFFDGHLNYFNKEERTALSSWLNGVGKEKARDYFISKILKQNQVDNYTTSTLKSMW